MNEETTKLLQQLAEKFGTTVEHLWAILVRQAVVNAVINILMLVFSLSLLIVAAWLFRRSLKWSDDSSDDLPLFATIVSGVLGACFAVVFIISIFGVGDAMTGFVNPEYWALKQILK